MHGGFWDAAVRLPSCQFPPPSSQAGVDPAAAHSPALHNKAASSRRSAASPAWHRHPAEEMTKDKAAWSKDAQTPPVPNELGNAAAATSTEDVCANHVSHNSLHKHQVASINETLGVTATTGHSDWWHTGIKDARGPKGCHSRDSASFH